ncbi:MAG: DUF2063 domain-containing protein [Cellvibrionales bacterium]|jgi:hypothetical protein|nr:DUF2063 domain-containing protein [Cellvibrionales bacterium]MBT6579089.1 DUF2063 domain-containing protein [Cellvibrionales bacterium]
MSTSLADVQRAFAAHIREPSVHPAPADIEDRRMNIYRELFYKNIEGFISSAFPILRKLYSDTDWHQMVRDFIHRHQSQTPYFLEISEEFLSYLDDEREPQSCDPVFALQLARYEWAELALFVAEQDTPEDAVSADHSLIDHIPVLSPLAWSMVFDYPVHQIGETFRPEQPSEQPVCLVVYRNRQDKVAFLEANPVTARFLELCEGNGERLGRDLLLQIAQELQHPDPNLVVNAGTEILAQLRQLDIIYGVPAAS